VIAACRQVIAVVDGVVDDVSTVVASMLTKIIKAGMDHMKAI
jgi:hypothetical protein